MKTVLDNAGRIVLPDFVQAHLGVKPGDELNLEQEEDRWVLKPVQNTVAGEEELNWADLDYATVPPKQGRQVTIRIEQRGKLRPLAHDLDEE